MIVSKEMNGALEERRGHEVGKLDNTGLIIEHPVYNGMRPRESIDIGVESATI